MNTHKVFTALIVTGIFLTGYLSSSPALAFKKKHAPQSAGSSVADNSLHFNHHVDPYVPNDIRGAAGQGVSAMCTEKGVLVNNPNLSGSCLDYISPSTGTSWRIRYVAGGRQSGTAERIFKRSGNSMTLWVLFSVSRDHVGEALYTAAGAQKQYVASGGRQRGRCEPRQANENQKFDAPRYDSRQYWGDSAWHDFEQTSEMNDTFCRVAHKRDKNVSLFFIFTFSNYHPPEQQLSTRKYYTHNRLSLYCYTGNVIFALIL